jgi:ATP-dependent Clp protease ATP-binding subunit ClpC
MNLKLTPRMQRVVASAEADAMARGQNFLGTEHLLIALASDRDGIAGLVLEELGVADRAIQRVREIMDSPGYDQQP